MKSPDHIGAFLYRSLVDISLTKSIVISKQKHPIMIAKGTAKPGDMLKVVKIVPFPGMKVAPSLKLGQELPLNQICLDGKGNEHFDVGLRSNYRYITSQETGEELPKGDEDPLVIHWCHPSRFELAKH